MGPVERLKAAPLASVRGLRHLAIRWNTKVSDLSPVGRISSLETLILEDTPKVMDLAPLAGLHALTAMEFSGGIWNKNHAISLEPLSRLPALEELHLLNLVLGTGGLRPLALCSKLKTLLVSNQFETEDYAFLSVRLPNTECRMFAPYVRLDEPIEGKDVMVVGKRKPFLSSTLDAKRLARYVRKFEQRRAEFSYH